MPDQTPADLIRQYITNKDRLKEIDLEQKNLKAAQKQIPTRLGEVLGELRYSEVRRFWDEASGSLVKITRGNYGEPDIEVEEPPSLDSLTWPEPEPELTPDSADASDRFLAEPPSADFELPAVAEAVGTCADDVF